MLTKCNAPPFQKVLCNDGLGCYCEAFDGLTPPKEQPDLQACEKCARLTAWNSDGSVNERGMALFFLEKLLEAEREIKKLRDMQGRGDSGSRNVPDASEKIWSI